MAKVKKGGKKGGGKKGGKKAEPQEADLMTEVEKELFQIQITDLQQKVERMKTRCLELEMSNEEYQKRYEQLDEDRADIIAYLKKMLQEKEDEITELKERLEGLQKTLEQDKQMYEEKIANLQHEFKVMHEQLTSEIKLLTGKLNSLEEFRLQRDDLMKKFKVQENKMEEQEERHRRTIYDIERKFIIGKDKLKNEMEAKLLQLSLDFQDATHVRIAATTHRTIRENIAINNELVRMVESSKKLTEENEKMRARDRMLNLQVKLREEERDMVVDKSMVQVKLISRLSTEYEEMAKHLGELQYAAQRYEDMKQELKENAAFLDRAVKQITMLEECLQAANYENSELVSKLLNAEKDTYLLHRVLREAVRSIKEALAVQREPSEDEAFKLSRRENLLSNLLQLLNTANLPEFEEREMRLQSLVTTSAVYEIGDLGLVPRSSSELKQELSEIYTVGSGFVSKESVKVDSKSSSKVKMSPSGDTVSTMSTVVGSESSSTIVSSKTSGSSSSKSVTKPSKISIESDTKKSASKYDIIKEVPKDEDILQSSVTEVGAEITEPVSEETEQAITTEQDAVQQSKQDDDIADLQQEIETDAVDDQQAPEATQSPPGEDVEQKETEEQDPED